MDSEKKISTAVINRLPRYFRYLGDLLESDITRISSKELSVKMNITASQIRQDLNNFGGFGQQGYGYNVEDLYRELGKILGLDKHYNAVICGTGNLGQAIANYKGIEDAGFKIVSLFDRNPKMVGMKISDIEVRDIDILEDFISKNKVEIGIITVPKEGAQPIADRLVKAGIKGIWNFAPTDLNVPEEVVVENVRLNESIFILSYFLNAKDK